MPIDFAAFTADRRVTARVFLADDRLSDMLNSVARIVLRDATVEDLVDGDLPLTGDVTVPIGELVVVVGTGPRGGEAPRRRTRQQRVTVGLGRYVVSGAFHVPADAPALPDIDDPEVLFAGRDLLVPLTGATITYDANGSPVIEEHEAVLVNRARVGWIEVHREVVLATEEDDEPSADGMRRPTYLKDFTNSVAE
jgi:hypothetical protein